LQMVLYTMASIMVVRCFVYNYSQISCKGLSNSVRPYRLFPKRSPTEGQPTQRLQCVMNLTVVAFKGNILTMIIAPNARLNTVLECKFLDRNLMNTSKIW